jgi:hypothetical protein
MRVICCADDRAKRLRRRLSRRCEFDACTTADTDSHANPQPNAFSYASSYTYSNSVAHSDPNTAAYA